MKSRVATIVFIASGFLLFGCTAQAPQPCKGDDDCCNGRQCGINEGDCDSDIHCAGTLICGNDNCEGDGFDGTDDCCYEGPGSDPSQGPDSCSSNTLDKAIALLGLEKAGNRADRRRALIEDLAKTSSYDDVDLDNWPLVDMRTLVGFASISHILRSQNIKTLNELSEMNYEDQRKAVIEAIVERTEGSSQNLHSLGDFALTMEASRLFDEGVPKNETRTEKWFGPRSDLGSITISCNGHDECCSVDNQCNRGEGDCDEDDHCYGALTCGEDNCGGRPEFDESDDCCEGERFEDTGSEIVETCMCGMKGPTIEEIPPTPRRGHLRPNIIGGQNTTENEFPWQVEIRINNEFSGGGTLITPSHVLTAAHVVVSLSYGLENARDVKALLGSNAKDRNIEFAVHDISPHHSYTRECRLCSLHYDFAILELETPVPFDETMLPACLPGPTTPNLVDEKVIVTGWGRVIADRPSFQPTLLKTPYPMDSIRIISNTDCQEEYGTDLTVDDSMICTGANGEVDACRGDSGGPMVVKDSDTQNWTLVGVVSFGRGCSRDVPGVFGQVATVMDWIRVTVNRKGSQNKMYDVQCNNLN